MTRDQITEVLRLADGYAAQGYLRGRIECPDEDAEYPARDTLVAYLESLKPDLFIMPNGFNARPVILNTVVDYLNKATSVTLTETPTVSDGPVNHRVVEFTKKTVVLEMVVE